MRCRDCHAEFPARDARPRPNRGTGGSSPPALMVAAAVGFSVATGVAAAAGWVGWIALAGMAVVAIGGALVAVTDACTVACPRCGRGGQSRWPWSR